MQDAAHDRGLYLRAIPPDRISFMPPLIITRAEVDDAVSILKLALDDVLATLRE